MTTHDPITLAEGECVHVVIDGLTVCVEHLVDGGGEHAVELVGVDCSLEGEMPGMYYPKPFPTFDVGDAVVALYPNARWGEGEVVEVRSEDTLKRYVVRRADGQVGYFHPAQIADSAIS